MTRVMQLSAKDLESQEKRKELTVCVVGLGRTGLVTACLLAEANFTVIGVDSSSHTVHQLKKGRSPFTETTFRRFVEPRIRNDKFRATTNLRKAVSESGIKTAEDVTLLRDMGVDAILVGETLVKSKNLLAKTRELVGAGQIEFGA